MNFFKVKNKKINFIKNYNKNDYFLYNNKYYNFLI